MATPSGYAFFLRKEVNFHMKRILDYWRDYFLSTSASTNVLTEELNGWLSEEARKVIQDETNLDPNHRYSFEELFGHSRADGKHWGFKSRDDFFTRKFADYDKLRPVYAPDHDSWVVSACESKPFALQTHVEAYDTFWLKGQPYSVYEMLDKEEEAEQFVDAGLLERHVVPPLAFSRQRHHQESEADPRDHVLRANHHRIHESRWPRPRCPRQGPGLYYACRDASPHLH